MNTLRVSLVSAAAMVALASVAPAMAMTSASAPLSVTIFYDDLNLANAQDLNELYVRLQSATRQVCSPYAVSQVNRYAAKKTCYRQVLTKAVRDVKSQDLVALHNRVVRLGQTIEQWAGGSGATHLSK